MNNRNKTPKEKDDKEGFVSIWWYTEDGAFWDFSTATDNAVESQGYLKYSDTDNHQAFWEKAVKIYAADASKREEIVAKGYLSLSRGSVVFNIRTMCYEVHCCPALLDNIVFRKACVEHFHLSGNRYDFVALTNYSKH